MVARGGHGPVAFVLEHGQPNVDFVRRTLEMFIALPDHEVASVAVARKADFAALQTADLLANCYLARDSEWFKRLNRSGEIFQGEITKELILSEAKYLESAWR